MAKFNETDGFHIYGWMRSRLNLSGGELLAYALVRQFSMGDAGIYTGGVPYLAKFLGCSAESARKYLHSLVEKGLVISIDATRDNVPYKNYKATPQEFWDTPKNLEGDPQKIWGSTPNNFGVEYNMNRNKKEERSNNIFTPPSFEQVRDYCLERGNAIDPQQFIDYYSASGWMVGKNKMKDWKAAVRTWEARRRNEAPNPRPFPQQGHKPSVYENNARAWAEFERRMKMQYPDEQ